MNIVHDHSDEVQLQLDALVKANHIYELSYRSSYRKVEECNQKSQELLQALYPGIGHL